MNKLKKKIKKYSFFLKFFIIPSALWVAFSLFVAKVTAGDPDPLTWEDLLYTDIYMIAVWLVISGFISGIVYLIRRIWLGKDNDNKDIQKEEVLRYKSGSRKGISKPYGLSAGAADQTEQQALYTCESSMRLPDYMEMSQYFPHIYWAYVLKGTFCNFVVSVIMALILRNIVWTLLAFVLLQICIMIFFKFRYTELVEKSYGTLQERGEAGVSFRLMFYESCFIRQGKSGTLRTYYSNIDKCIETRTNFYMWDGQRNIVFILQKKQCELELINFMRKKFNLNGDQQGAYDDVQRIRQYQGQSKVKMAMLVLFILTLFSLYGAGAAWAGVNQQLNVHGFGFAKVTWVFWLWLPVPVLSVILGFKYRKAGVKCTKNIVAGFIVGFLLLAFGSFSIFAPSFTRDYRVIKSYSRMIDAVLPENGELEVMNIGTYVDEDKTDYTITRVYYDREDTTALENSIKHSTHWVLSTQMKSELMFLVPSTFYSGEGVYYSLYNRTSDEYNTVPGVSGSYEIYVMRYDQSMKTLEIHRYRLTENVRAD